MPIDDTESGIVMLSRDVQLVKAPFPIDVTESGIIMLSRDLQLAKASFPIEVTESGIVTFVMLRNQKASSQMICVPGLILKLVMKTLLHFRSRLPSLE